MLSLSPHRLLESILWSPSEGYFLLKYHLQRLTASAAGFGLILKPDLFDDRLAAFAQTLQEPAKVRLLLDASAEITLEAVPLSAGVGALREPIRVGLAPQPVDSADPWLRHKTTHHPAYKQTARLAPGCDDCLLWNERRELTEATGSNVVVALDGQKWTPPVSCGLLPGTFRRQLLETGEIQEQVLPVECLEACEAIFLINSVRRWRRAVLAE